MVWRVVSQRQGPRSSSSAPREPRQADRAEAKQEERDRRIRLLSEVDELEVEIDRLVQGGSGLAMWQRIPLLVEGAAPRERVRIRLTERRPDYARAEVVEVLRPSAIRVDPPCVYYETCGGCDLQHVRSEEQLAVKASAALEALGRLGGLRDLPQPELIAGSPFGYRSRAQIHTALQPQGSQSAAPRVHVGFKPKSGKGVVDVAECIVLTPSLQAALTAVRSVVAERVREPLEQQEQQGQRAARDRRSVDERGADPPAAALDADLPHRIDLLAGDDGRWVMAPVLEGLPRGEVTTSVEVKGRSYSLRCHASSFFQGHGDLAGRLAEIALADLESVAAGAPTSLGDEKPLHGVAWDLYAGVGLMTLPLTELARHVVAVEGDRGAVRNLKHNTRRFGEQVRVAAESVENFLGKELRRPSQRPDLIVVDPPRSGLTKLVRAAIAHIRPPRLRYVSCDPATLARDLRALSERYRVVSLSFVDLFPQTSHLEVVVALEAATASE